MSEDLPENKYKASEFDAEEDIPYSDFDEDAEVLQILDKVQHNVENQKGKQDIAAKETKGINKVKKTSGSHSDMLKSVEKNATSVAIGKESSMVRENAKELGVLNPNILSQGVSAVNAIEPDVRSSSSCCEQVKTTKDSNTDDVCVVEEKMVHSVKSDTEDEGQCLMTNANVYTKYDANSFDDSQNETQNIKCQNGKRNQESVEDKPISKCNLSQNGNDKKKQGRKRKPAKTSVKPNQQLSAVEGSIKQNVPQCGPANKTIPTEKRDLSSDQCSPPCKKRGRPKGSKKKDVKGPSSSSAQKITSNGNLFALTACGGPLAKTDDDRFHWKDDEESSSVINQPVTKSPLDVCIAESDGENENFVKESWKIADVGASKKQSTDQWNPTGKKRGRPTGSKKKDVKQPSCSSAQKITSNGSLFALTESTKQCLGPPAKADDDRFHWMDDEESSSVINHPVPESPIDVFITESDKENEDIVKENQKIIKIANDCASNKSLATDLSFKESPWYKCMPQHSKYNTKWFKTYGKVRGNQRRQTGDSQDVDCSGDSPALKKLSQKVTKTLSLQMTYSSQCVSSPGGDADYDPYTFDDNCSEYSNNLKLTSKQTKQKTAKRGTVKSSKKTGKSVPSSRRDGHGSRKNRSVGESVERQAIVEESIENVSKKGANLHSCDTRKQSYTRKYQYTSDPNNAVSMYQVSDVYQVDRQEPVTRSKTLTTNKHSNGTSRNRTAPVDEDYAIACPPSPGEAIHGCSLSGSPMQSQSLPICSFNAWKPSKSYSFMDQKLSKVRDYNNELIYTFIGETSLSLMKIVLQFCVYCQCFVFCRAALMRELICLVHVQVKHQRKSRKEGKFNYFLKY